MEDKCKQYNRKYRYSSLVSRIAHFKPYVITLWHLSITRTLPARSFFHTVYIYVLLMRSYRINFPNHIQYIQSTSDIRDPPGPA